MLEQIEDLEMMKIIHQNHHKIQNSRVVKYKEKYENNEENPVLEMIFVTLLSILFTLYILVFWSRI